MPTAIWCYGRRSTQSSAHALAADAEAEHVDPLQCHLSAHPYGRLHITVGAFHPARLATSLAQDRFLRLLAPSVTVHSNLSMEMIDHLLTFEVDSDGDQLVIHGDPAGLRVLLRALERLVAHAEAGNPEHDHLLTEEWGGDELSSRAQTTDGSTRLVHHVKLYGWPTPEGSGAYMNHPSE